LQDGVIAIEVEEREELGRRRAVLRRRRVGQAAHAVQVDAVSADERTRADM
jgi:hypothetical protein